MSDNIQTGFAAACGFFLIGCTTWFFASRRKTFIRTFVPADELREVSRSLPRGEQFRRGMRAMGLAIVPDTLANVRSPHRSLAVHVTAHLVARSNSGMSNLLGSSDAAT